MDVANAVAEDLRAAKAAAEARWAVHGMKVYGGPGDPKGVARADAIDAGFQVVGSVGPAMGDSAVRAAWLKYAAGPTHGKYRGEMAWAAVDAICREIPDWRGKLRVKRVNDVLKRFPADGAEPLDEAFKGELAKRGISGEQAEAIAAKAVDAVIACCRRFQVDVRVDIAADGWADRRRKDRPTAMAVASRIGFTLDDLWLAEFGGVRRTLPGPAGTPPRVQARLYSEALDEAMAAIGIPMPVSAIARRARDFPKAETDAAIRSAPALATALGVDPASLGRFKPGYDWSKLIVRAAENAEDKETFWRRLDAAVSAREAKTAVPRPRA